MRVEFKQINKWFGKVHANKDISLTIPAGCIQGILGENGAGKSTLMKVLSGFISADSGAVLVDDRAVQITSPADALAYGVGMLHQDPLDFPTMRVSDNLLIGSSGSFVAKRQEAVAAMMEIQHELHFALDPDAYVDSLTVGERQQLELIRLLWLGAQVLILDEPTTGISGPQKKMLFAALRRLADQGKTIIFVTHKLDEVHELCYRAAVLRAGELVAELEAPYRNQDFIEHMFGRVVELPPRQSAKKMQTVFELRGTLIEDYRMTVGPVDLKVGMGEVIGFAGMEGSGQDLLLRMCAGLIRPVAGDIVVNGTAMTGAQYQTFLNSHIKYLPADRLAEGLIAGLTLTEHFALAQREHGFFVDYSGAESLANERINEFNIRGTSGGTVDQLSGGNQQRTLIAMLEAPLSLLLLEQPTRGLDMESAIWMWNKLKERAQTEGTAIIYISSDLEDVLHYSDRVLVFFAGTVSQPLDSATTTVKALGELIGGIGLETIHDESTEATIRAYEPV